MKKLLHTGKLYDIIHKCGLGSSFVNYANTQCWDAPTHTWYQAIYFIYGGFIQ